MSACERPLTPPFTPCQPPDDVSNPLLLGHMINDGAGDVLIPHCDSADMDALAPVAMRYLEVRAAPRRLMDSNHQK